MNGPSTESTKEKTPVAGEQGGVFGCNQRQADVTAQRDESKLYSTLQAKFALAGHTLYKTINPDGTVIYLAGKWGYFREIKGLEAVAAFLAMIGGAR